MTKKEAATHIIDLTEQIKGLQDELDERKRYLLPKMKAGEEIIVGTKRVYLCATEEKILWDNEKILEVVGPADFVKAAKIGCGALKKALADMPEFFAAQTFDRCIKAVTTKNVIKVLDVK